MGVFLLVLLGFQFGLCCLPPPSPSTNPPTLIISGCEEEQSNTCQTTNGIKCVFPFRNGSTKYTSCADYNGLYTWCATSLKEDCSYDKWGKCDDTDCGAVPEGGHTTTTVTTTTTMDMWRHGNTSVSVTNGEKTFVCDIIFNYNIKNGMNFNNIESSCSGSIEDSEAISRLGMHTFSLRSKDDINFECSLGAALVGNILSREVLTSTMKCEAKNDQCITIEGNVFPTKCLFPFIYEGRKYQGCTNIASKDPLKLWCATEVDETGEMVDGQWGYCSSVCGFCAGSPIKRVEDSKPCGYNCLINPNKVMEPITEIDPQILGSPMITENKNQALLPWNWQSNQLRFNIGHPGVFLTCENGFNHFSCYQEIFVKCTGKYQFTVYEANIKNNHIKNEIKNDVKNTHLGCNPCPIGYDYKKGYESRTLLTNLGDFSNIGNEKECKSKCDKVDCLTFAFSPITKTCKLHSIRVENPRYDTYKDYRLCVKSKKNLCISCCEEVTISSKGGISDYQSARLGTYIKNGKYNNNDVYKQIDGSKIIYFSKTGGFRWVVASSITSNGGIRSEVIPTSKCPNDAKEWEYYIPGTTSTWVVDEKAAIRCNRELCPTDYTFIPGTIDQENKDDIIANHNFITNAEECMKLCNSHACCTLFQFSIKSSQCSLHNQNYIVTNQENSNSQICKKELDSCCKVKKNTISRLCGLNLEIDKTHLLAEENAGYIFNFIDNSEESRSEFKTQVFEVVSFDEYMNPTIRDIALNDYVDIGLVLLFMAPSTAQCNQIFFTEYTKSVEKYYPLSITVSNLPNITINKIINNIGKFRCHYYGEKPKICGAHTRMRSKTAFSRQRELTSLFNFPFQDGDRVFDDIENNVCKTVDDTLNTMAKSDIYDFNADLQFIEPTIIISERNGFATLTIKKTSPSKKAAVSFVKTEFPIDNSICEPISNDDIIPLSTIIIFGESENEKEVILEVNIDEEFEDSECCFINLVSIGDDESQKNTRMFKRTTMILRNMISTHNNFITTFYQTNQKREVLGFVQEYTMYRSILRRWLEVKPIGIILENNQPIHTVSLLSVTNNNNLPTGTNTDENKFQIKSEVQEDLTFKTITSMVRSCGKVEIPTKDGLKLFFLHAEIQWLWSELIRGTKEYIKRNYVWWDITDSPCPDCEEALLEYIKRQISYRMTGETFHLKLSISKIYDGISLSCCDHNEHMKKLNDASVIVRNSVRVFKFIEKLREMEKNSNGKFKFTFLENLLTDYWNFNDLGINHATSNLLYEKNYHGGKYIWVAKIQKLYEQYHANKEKLEKLDDTLNEINDIEIDFLKRKKEDKKKITEEYNEKVRKIREQYDNNEIPEKVKNNKLFKLEKKTKNKHLKWERKENWKGAEWKKLNYLIYEKLSPILDPIEDN